MEPSSPNNQPPVKASGKRKFSKIVYSKKFTYVFMMALLVYLLLCGYVLIFSGSIFYEGLVKGGYKTDASDYDLNSLVLGYLFGFASFFGVIGGLMVLSTRPERMRKFKILFFIPSMIWSTLLTVGHVQWGTEYWEQWLYLVPIMILCMFILFGVVKKVSIPYFGNVPHGVSEI